MRIFLGIIMIIAGAILGLYVGIWVCFIGGIVDIINEIKGPDLSALNIAWGITKIFLASFAGWGSAMFLIFPGVALIGTAE